MNKLNNTTHFDTPLRKSEMRLSIRAALSSTNSRFNDDEEERRVSRAHHESLLETSTATTLSVIAESDELKSCLKKFVDNKINKDNAWSMSLIDNFSTLIERHHKSLNSFQVCGTSLEASSKIYGYRVDSVHDEVLRISSGLTRHKNTNNRDEANDRMDNDNGGGGDDGGGDDNDMNNENGANQNDELQPKTKKKRTRRQKCTVTKNKDTINGKLETHSFIDPMFAKINSVIGDISSSNKLLLNTLPTTNAELILATSNKYWNEKHSEDIQPYDDLDQYEYDKELLIRNVIPPKFTNMHLLRPQCSGYIITDTPAEEEEKDEKTLTDNDMDIDIDVAFDMNADVEPIENADTYVDVYLDGQDFNSLTQTDQNALTACRGLRRAPIVVEDMRPIDSRSMTLEYSYRPLDGIGQFWAGPSYWKFKRQRSTLFAGGGAGGLALRESQFQQQQMLLQKGGKQPMKKRAIRNRIDTIQFDEKTTDEIEQLYISINSKTADKLKKTNICRKWDAKKLKLPMDYQIDELRFESYHFAPGLKYNFNTEPSSTPDIEASGYNYDNPADADYCSNVVPDDDTDTEQSASASGDVIVNNANINVELNSNTTVGEIGTVFEGAPAKINKIDVPFAKRAKVIDMKLLKKCSLNILEKQFKDTENIPMQTLDKHNKEYRKGEATFSKTYRMLPCLLTKSMKEALTPSVAFYSLLHLANDHKLRLTSNDDLCGTDFKIRQLDSTKEKQNE